MPLREEFEASGNWLFRWRSFIPLFLVVPLLAAMHDPDYLCQDRSWPDWWGLFSLTVSFCGLGVRVLTVGHAPEGTSGRNTKGGQIAVTLNTTGMYSVVRHPLYLGNFIMWFGVALFCGIWWMTVIVALAFWLYYERIMFAEEEFLRRKFGESYVQWAGATPAFLPDFRKWRPPELPFSWKSVLRREYPGLFAVVAVFWCLEAYSRIVVQRDWSVEPLWSSIFLSGAMVFFVLRTLKRRTTLLVVKGR